MRRRHLSLIVALLLVFGFACQVAANENPGFRRPTYFGPMTPAEKAFAASIATDLQARFPTPADAVKAGYVRYTGVDDTGAISYANGQWQSSDLKHPSQLWYSKRGKLLGADFSRLKVGDTPPRLWGINPGRWWEFDRHMHYVTRNHRTGKVTYDLYVADDDFLNAGGSLAHPQAATLVKMHQVKYAKDVVTIFNFPALWDLIVWAVPNPKGAFAYKNPSVHA
ncbi:MAG: hypothetical protein JO349_09720 [Candidatus Eremiobacteraeota bacterium]|nr:hypothetical protein [Candidatus Eremiobacteraeota bacterium]